MTDLEHYFDVIERASMTKALEKGDEQLAGEAAEARERIRERIQTLEAALREIVNYARVDQTRIPARMRDIAESALSTESPK